MKQNKDFKIAFIFVLCKTPKEEIERLKDEVKRLGFKDYRIYFPDNSNNHQGYAYGVNIGLKQALKDGCNLFVVANPDISLKNLSKKILDAAKYFDIWGLAMKQDEKIYYGGMLDKKRLTAGLSDKKPRIRFFTTDFVSGSLMFIKKEVIDKIGFFDESYFMYYEEVDFCFRAKRAGFRVGVDTQYQYQHFETSKENPKKNQYLFLNHLKFFWRYGNLYQKIYELFRLPKTVIEEIRKRTFYFNFFSYNFFSILGKVLSFIQFIVLVRIFPPNIFGIYSLSWAHLGMFLPMVDFGTTNFGIINLPQEKKIIFSDILSLRFYLSILVFFLSIFSALLLPYSLTTKIAIFLVSFVSFQASFFGSLLIKLTNEEKIYLLSVISFLFQLLITATIIVVSFLFKNIIYVFGVIFVFYLIYGLGCFFYLKSKENNFRLKFNWPKFKTILSYSIFYLLISIFARWYSRIDVFLLNFLKNEEAVGIYSSAYRFLEALMFMVTAYNLSALPMLVNFYKNNRLDLIKLKIKKDFLFLLVIGGGISAIFYFFSPIFLPLVFKNKYMLAIPILKIIIFSLPLILLTSIFFNLFYTIKKIHYVLGLMIFQLFFNFSLNWIFIPKYSYFAAAYISLIGEVINLFICLYFYQRVQNKFLSSHGTIS
jgi:O-antigen/teichoic acid export membrane protein